MTVEDQNRGSAWWRRLADGVQVDESWDLDSGDDPWGELDVDAPPLTPDQRTFLATLEDQPPVPRLDGLAAEGDGEGSYEVAELEEPPGEPPD